MKVQSYGQVDLFQELENQRLHAQQERMFQEWLGLPNELLIPASSPERPGVPANLNYGYCMRWNCAHHRCPGLVAEGHHYIWLNCVQAPEYWVMNPMGDPVGEHIDICPFCGADLTHGGGDVVLCKADDDWWRIWGFIT